MTTHTFRVTLHRDDRSEAIDAGLVTFTGEDYDTFDGAAARAALIADGRLTIGGELVTFGDVLVPAAKLDRVTITLEAKGR